MIHKIQYLRKLPVIGMPSYVPLVRNNRGNQTPAPTLVAPDDLIFHSIDDLNATSNQPLVHNRDAAGNIILINDTGSNNQILTIESISYTVSNTVLNNVINTQFNYFKFPPRVSNVEVVDEINLTDAVEEVDLISTRFTPTATSGRQQAIGTLPVLRAGSMIAEGVDDALVVQKPTGYYRLGTGSFSEIFSILNMETVLAGTSQLKPSKFIITPDMIDAGEDLFFRIRIQHEMSGNGIPLPAGGADIIPWANPAPGSAYNNFRARLTKVIGTTGAKETVMLGGSYGPAAYIDPTGVNLKTRLEANISDLRANLNTYKTYLKQYDNMLVTISDRTTTQQRSQLTLLKNRVDAAKLKYDTSRQTLKNNQIILSNKLANFSSYQPNGYIINNYEMLYIVDIASARPYDEYSIETLCTTWNNSIYKDSTYWQIVPISKIKNAFQ